jgi:hypothetical protein
MDSLADEEILEGRPPSEEEKFYLQWGRETFKRNLAFANDLLRALITLTAALLAGTVGLLSETVVHPAFRVIVTGLLLLSLTAALVGAFPYRADVDLRVPALIRLHKENAQRVKLRWLARAGTLLGVAGAAAIAGLVARWLWQF